MALFLILSLSSDSWKQQSSSQSQERQNKLLWSSQQFTWSPLTSGPPSSTHQLASRDQRGTDEENVYTDWASRLWRGKDVSRTRGREMSRQRVETRVRGAAGQRRGTMGRASAELGLGSRCQRRLGQRQKSEQIWHRRRCPRRLLRPASSCCRWGVARCRMRGRTCGASGRTWPRLLPESPCRWKGLTRGPKSRYCGSRVALPSW